MIDIQLELWVGGLTKTVAGGVWNAAVLGARSDYGFTFEGRDCPKAALLKQYPRWCEPVSGLVARCLALSNAPAEDVLRPGWEPMVVKIALRPGGREGDVLDTVAAERGDDGELTFIRVPAIGGARQLNCISPRASYGDPWDLAEHALRLTTFDDDALPAPKELDVPVRRDGDLSFVCTRDIPEPARSVFEERMQHSTRPVVQGYADAVYVWDWMDFLGGNR